MSDKEKKICWKSGCNNEVHADDYSGLCWMHSDTAFENKVRRIYGPNGCFGILFTIIATWMLMAGAIIFVGSTLERLDILERAAGVKRHFPFGKESKLP